MKIHSGVMAVAFVAAAVSLAQGQNILQNPGFEAWTGGMPDRWQRDDSIFIKQDDDRVHSGAFSARDSLVTQNQERGDLCQGAFAASPNTQYTFAAYVYDNDPAGRIRQMVSWHAAGGWSQDFSSSYSSNSAAWQAMSMTVVSPPGTDSALVSFRAYDSSAAWDGHAVFNIDDASFTPAAVQPPVIARAWHRPTNPAAGSLVQVFCIVYDDGTIVNDTLFYGINGLSVLYRITHAAVCGDTFKYQIPGQPGGDTVLYYMRYLDDDGLAAVTDTNSLMAGTVGLKINEVYYDAPGEDSGCFVELHGPPGMGLGHMALAGVNGTNGSDYALIALDPHTVPSDGFFVIGQDQTVPNCDTVTPAVNLQNGPDNLELRCGSVIIDALGYGGQEGWVFTGEWLPAPDVPEGHCLGRYPDGHDNDNNSLDFTDYDTITPGLPNAAASVGDDRKKPGARAPEHSGVVLSGPFRLGSIINDERCYPVYCYDCLGRLVAAAVGPQCEMCLRPGVYFILSGGSGDERRSIKLVVLS